MAVLNSEQASPCSTRWEGGRKLRFGGSAELGEEAEVVLEVVAEVIDLPFQHGDALESHSESEAGIFLRVYARCLQHVRIHHAASQNLQPAGSFADVAAFAMADVAAYIDFRGRFREREI